MELTPLICLSCYSSDVLGHPAQCQEKQITFKANKPVINTLIPGNESGADLDQNLLQK